jgi:polysaccharide biosynthesis/export protein
MRRALIWIVGVTTSTASPLAAQSTPAPSSDFRTGDRIMMTVVGEPQLSDTFTVVAGPAIDVPVIGTVPLAGVKETGLEHYLTDYIGRYVRNPVVHATAMIRLGVLGEVAHPGFYALSSQALLEDALMTAGGVTQTARVDGLYLSRADAPDIANDSLHRAIAGGVTIAELGVRSGDELVVPRVPAFDRTARIIGLLVTVPAAVIALLRFR